MTARVEVFKPTGEFPGWVEGEGMKDTMLELVWRGPARIQPNIDWRARVRDVGSEFNATMAVRFNLPVGKNELNGVVDDVGHWIAYGPDPSFGIGYVVRVIDAPVAGTQLLYGRDYTVRNALPGSEQWAYNLLCDTGTNSGTF
jgi:hypothetical protein